MSAGGSQAQGELTRFAGFPSRAKATAIPNVFFTDVLPQLTEGVELAVVLYALRAIQEKRGFPRCITSAELHADGAVAAFLTKSGASETDVRTALRRAVELGVLLPLTVEREGRRLDLYFLNAPADRRALEAARRGEVDLGRVLDDVPPGQPPRPSVFALYESHIGTLTPAIVDELTEAERLYPADWLEAAFREAAAQNARSWRYVSRILERWAIEGPDHAKTERDAAIDERYFRGKYGRVLRERLGR